MSQDSLAPVPAARRSRRARWRLGVVLACLAVAIGAILYEGLFSSLNYYYTVSQALARRATLGTTSFRLEGVVVPHTVRQTTKGSSFAIEGGGHTVLVDNTGSPPELFQPGIPVILVGHFTTGSSSLFRSSQIIIDHTSTYTPQPPTTTASHGATT